MSDFADTPILEKNITSLSDATVRGIGWQSISSMAQIALAFVTQILLSRLLTPTDFGTVVYAMIFIGFSAQIAQAGIAPALIQRRNLNGNHLSAGFLISVSIGLVVWVILWLLSPVIVQTSDGIKILRVLSFIFLFNSLTIVSDALLQRRFLFRKLFWIDNISYGIGAGLVAIVCALQGYGAWSLVFGTLVQSVSRGVMLFAFSPFSVSLKIKKEDFRSLLNFGTGMTLARLANFAAGNSSQFVAGTILGAVSLGLFQRAYQLITIPLTKIAGVATSVLFPALSRIQDNIPQLRKTYLFLVALAAVVTFPLATFVSVSANEIILVLYGQQWIKAVNSLAILSFNAAFISIFTLTDVLARAKGKVYSQFRRHLTYAIFALIGAVLGSRYDIDGVALGLTTASCIMYLLNADLALKITEMSWFEFFKAQKVGLVLSLPIGSALFLYNKIALGWFGGNILIALLIKTIFALLVFLISAVLIPTAWYENLKQPLVAYMTLKFPSVNWKSLSKIKVNADA